MLKYSRSSPPEFLTRLKPDLKCNDEVCKSTSLSSNLSIKTRIRSKPYRAQSGDYVWGNCYNLKESKAEVKVKNVKQTIFRHKNSTYHKSLHNKVQVLSQQMLTTEKKQTPKTFYCDICNKNLSTRSSLQRHKRTVHAPEENSFCKRCKRWFKTKARLMTHQRRHKSASICKYPGCFFVFYDHSEGVMHQSDHTGIIPVFCSICNIPFRTMGALKNHQWTHQPAMLHCSDCGRQYKTNYRLKLHRQRCATSPQLICPIHDEYRLSDINLDLRTEGCPFTWCENCKHCGRGFKTKVELRQHVKNCNTWECPRCQSTHYSEKLLHEHLLFCTHEAENKLVSTISGSDTIFLVSPANWKHGFHKGNNYKNHSVICQTEPPVSVNRKMGNLKPEDITNGSKMASTYHPVPRNISIVSLVDDDICPPQEPSPDLLPFDVSGDAMKYIFNLLPPLDPDLSLSSFFEGSTLSELALCSSLFENDKELTDHGGSVRPHTMDHEAISDISSSRHQFDLSLSLQSDTLFPFIMNTDVTLPLMSSEQHCIFDDFQTCNISELTSSTTTFNSDTSASTFHTPDFTSLPVKEDFLTSCDQTNIMCGTPDDLAYPENALLRYDCEGATLYGRHQKKTDMLLSSVQITSLPPVPYLLPKDTQGAEYVPLSSLNTDQLLRELKLDSNW